MNLQIAWNPGDVTLSEAERRRVDHQIEALDRRLVHHPEPQLTITLKAHPTRRAVQADLRLQLGPLGPHLVSHQSAETADRGIHIALDDLERQLERRLAKQRKEPAYGVPSRRLPKQLRPNPASAESASGPARNED